MDCNRRVESVNFFGTHIKYIALTWLGSMLLRFGIQTGTRNETMSLMENEIENGSVLESLFVLGLCFTACTVYCTNILRRCEQHNKETSKINDPTLFGLREYTLSELKYFDGSKGPIYIALNGKIFDVTKDKKHYDCSGCYKILAGRDASRAFATLSFDVNSLRSKYDDLSDLNYIQKSNLYEWEVIYTEKYTVVGKVVREHKTKSLQEMSMKSIINNIKVSQSKIHSIEQLPLPGILKRDLRNFMREHIDE